MEKDWNNLEKKWTYLNHFGSIWSILKKKNQKKTFENKFIIHRESMVGSVQATGTVEFEDGLRTGVLQEDCWCPYIGCTTLMSDRARPWPRCSVSCPRKPVHYRQTKYLRPFPALHDVDDNGVRETSRTGLLWIIPALSTRTRWFDNSDWHSFLVWSPSWHYYVVSVTNKNKKTLIIW